MSLRDLVSRIEQKEVTTCQGLQAELDKFTDLDRREWRPWTSPLRACALVDDVELIQTCLDNGIGINSPSVGGGTALSLSIASPKLKSLAYLLDQGAKVTIQNLAMALQKRDEPVFKVFCATLEAKYGLNSHNGLDNPKARIQQVKKKCISADGQTLSLDDFENILFRSSFELVESVLHVGFERSDGAGQIGIEP
jgi:hypothetical protein